MEKMKYIVEHGANVNIENEVSTNFSVLRENGENLKECNTNRCYLFAC